MRQYQKGQLYMIAKASREETNGSEGIEVLVNERFESQLGPGIYTHKIIHLSKYDFLDTHPREKNTILQFSNLKHV